MTWIDWPRIIDEKGEADAEYLIATSNVCMHSADLSLNLSPRYVRIGREQTDVQLDTHPSTINTEDRTSVVQTNYHG